MNEETRELLNEYLQIHHLQKQISKRRVYISRFLYTYYNIGTPELHKLKELLEKDNFYIALEKFEKYLKVNKEGCH